MTDDPILHFHVYEGDLFCRTVERWEGHNMQACTRDDCVESKPYTILYTEEAMRKMARMAVDRRLTYDKGYHDGYEDGIDD